MSRPRKQTAPAEMRSTDKEGEDTEDECTLSLEGRLKSPSLSRYRLLFSISPSPLLPLRLCGDKKSCPPYVDESQLFFLIISGTPVCMCVCVCVLVRLRADTVFLLIKWNWVRLFMEGKIKRKAERVRAKDRNEKKHRASHTY